MTFFWSLLTVPRHFEVAAYCKKTAKNFLYFTDDTYKSVLFTTACSFLFHQSNRLDKGGVRGCAKRRATIDSAQNWTDQAKHLSSESFLLCIPLDALLTAVYICLLTTKKRRKNSPYHSSSSLHSPNKQHVRQKADAFVTGVLCHSSTPMIRKNVLAGAPKEAH